MGKDLLQEGAARHCVGTLSYIYNHHERQLASLLTRMQYDHHDLTVSTMHAHPEHDNCIETVILRSRTDAVVQFAHAVIAEKGVRHGKFYPIPIDIEAANSKRHRHVHAHPHT